MSDEFCGWTCPRKKGEPCDLCEARARKRRNDQRQAAGLPTLTHRPFTVFPRSTKGRRTP